MNEAYRKELIQVAAVALAAAQVDECDTTSLCADSEGVRGRFAPLKLLDEVYEERRFQELKWGARNGEMANKQHWLAVLLEEVGEVVEEIVKVDAAAIDCPLVHDALRLGAQARALLEAK